MRALVATLARGPGLPQVGLVSFFLPFFPLERRHVRQLFGMHLARRGAELQRQKLGGLQWDPLVLDFLTSKVGSWLGGRV